MNCQIKISINCHENFFNTFMLCLNAEALNENTIQWKQNFCPNVNILIGNKFSSHNMLLKVTDNNFKIEMDNRSFDSEFNTLDLINICNIKYNNDNDLLKDIKLIEELAIKYFGKFWYKQFDAENKYLMCIIKLRELYDEVIRECGFDNLIDSLKLVINDNYIDFLITNNLFRFNCNQNKTLRELLIFSETFNKTYNVNIYEKLIMRSKIEEYLNVELDNLKYDNISFTVESLNTLSNNDDFNKLNKLNFDAISLKIVQLKTILYNHLKNDTIKNLQDFYVLNDSIKKLDLGCNIENILCSDNIIKSLCNLNNIESEYLLNYLTNLPNKDDLLLNIISQKIQYIYNNSFEPSEKLQYFLDLNSIVEKSNITLNCHLSSKIKFVVKKYINNLINNTETIEGQNNLSLELEKLYFKNNEINQDEIKNLRNQINSLQEINHNYAHLNDKIINLNDKVSILEKQYDNLNSVMSNSLNRLESVENNIYKLFNITTTSNSQLESKISNLNTLYEEHITAFDMKLNNNQQHNNLVQDKLLKMFDEMEKRIDNLNMTEPELKKKFYEIYKKYSGEDLEDDFDSNDNEQSKMKIHKSKSGSKENNKRKVVANR